MERSLEFAQSLDAVRKMPQQECSEIEEKREAAKKLRMEALFDNAECTKILIESIVADHSLSENKLIEIIESSGNIVYPGNVMCFIRALLENRNAVSEAMYDMLFSHKKNDKNFGEILFQWYVYEKTGKKAVTLNGEAQMKEFPLSIVLMLDDSKDFALIDDRSNVGGFFQKSFGNERQGEDRSCSFPLIVVNGMSKDFSPRSFDASVTLQHEKIHAENSVFKRSLANYDQKRSKVVWFDYDQIAINRNIINLVEAINRNGTWESVSETKEWKQALKYSLSKAKDELLANYDIESLTNRSATLRERGGLYDFFLKHLGIPQDSFLYESLWGKYEEILFDACHAAAFVMTSYDEMDSFELVNERKKKFRWVLAQIPLEHWEKQLKDSLFEKEADGLFEINAKIKEVYWSEMEAKAYSDEAVSAGKDIRVIIKEKSNQLLSELGLDNNSNKPLFEYIEKFKAFLDSDALVKQIGQI